MTSQMIDDLMARPYQFELVRDADGDGWVAWVRELRGCMSQGATPAAAIEMLQDAMRGWLESALRNGDPIPEPQPEPRTHSGRLLLRMPAGLHRELAQQAEAENVSLNQLAVALLAGGLGWRPAEHPTQRAS